MGVIGAYCNATDCEYWEDGDCEYEGSLKLDERGMCKCFRYGGALMAETTLIEDKS